jgi:hypothetical protein
VHGLAKFKPLAVIRFVFMRTSLTCDLSRRMKTC